MGGKAAKNNDCHKRPLTEAQTEECFQKKIMKTVGFQAQKDEKNIKPKKNRRSPLQALKKEL